MIAGLEGYETFVRSILKRVPLLKTEQLIKALVNNFEDIDKDVAKSILFAIQRRGYVMLSETGWAMTQAMYLGLTSDKFFDGVIKNNAYRIPEKIYQFGIDKETEKNGPLKEITIEEEVHKNRLQLQKCMWLVIDMLPDSFDFVVTETPWNVVFVSEPSDDRDGLLYQITYIPSKNEDLHIEILKSLPKIEDKELRENIRRIAIMEDERHAWKLPYIGFSHICVIDDNEEAHYRILNTGRKREDMWKDYVV